MGLNTFKLKMIALVFMVIDHIGMFIPGMPIWLCYVGRLSAPIFSFCLVWGLDYTKNRKRHLMTLYIASVIMAVLWLIINMNHLDKNGSTYLNIFSTFFIASAILILFQRYSFKKAICIFIVWQSFSYTVLLASSIFFSASDAIIRIEAALTGNIIGCEGGIGWIILILLLYCSKNNKKKLAVNYALYCVLYEFISATAIFARLFYYIDWHTDHVASEWMTIIYKMIFGEIPQWTPMVLHGLYWGDYQWIMIAALPLMLLYNNGRGRKWKWFFYIFYPVHIVILVAIGNYL